MACAVSRLVTLGLLRCAFVLTTSSVEISPHGEIYSAGKSKQQPLVRRHESREPFDPSTILLEKKIVPKSGTETHAPKATCHNGLGALCATCEEDDHTKLGHCASCNVGYHANAKDPKTCEAIHSCSIGGEMLCATCVEDDAAKHGQCGSCNPGYHKEEDGTCEAYECSASPEGASCKECVDAPSADNQCANCHSGYFLSGAACKAYDCTEGPEAGCKACVAQTHRKGHNECNSCNPGYFKEVNHAVGPHSHICKAYNCSADQLGAGCNSCLQQDSRTEHDQCESCNSGHFKTASSTCKAYNCTESPVTEFGGWGCKTCKDLAHRTDHNQCLSCHPGFSHNNSACHMLPICKSEVESIQVADTRAVGGVASRAGVSILGGQDEEGNSQGENKSCPDSIQLSHGNSSHGNHFTGLAECAQAVAGDINCANLFHMHRDSHECFCVPEWDAVCKHDGTHTPLTCVYELDPIVEEDVAAEAPTATGDDGR